MAKELYLGSDPINIQYGGGIRMYWKDRAAAGWHEVGHFENLSVSPSVTKEELKGTRRAARSVIKTRVEERKVSISATPLELSTENLRMAINAGAAVAASQLAGTRDLAELTVAKGLYVEVPHRDAYIIRIPHGDVTGGPFQVGETVTGETSSATGKVAWKETGLVELIGVTGEFRAGEKLTGGTSSAKATSAAVQHVKDVVLVDQAIPTTRYKLGVDYDFEADEGMLRVRENSSVSGNPHCAYSYEAHSAELLYALSGGDTINKAVRIVTDRDNDGPRYEIYYPSVDWVMNGDWALLTDGASNLPFEGTVLEDGSAPSGQGYGHIRLMR